MAPEQEKLRKRLKELRTLSGCSQAQVAYAAGLHREHYCMIERGYRNISPEKAAEIENYLKGEVERTAQEVSRKVRVFAELTA